MNTKSENNFSKVRINQINELYNWGTKNTNLEKVSVHDAVKFFYSDSENTPSDLLYVFQIFHELLKHSMMTFQIGNYVAIEYAMTVILRRTKGFDTTSIYKEIIQGDTLIRPPLSNSARIKIIQKIVSQMNKDQLDTSETIIIERLTKSEGFLEDEAKNAVESALKVNAITRTELGKLAM